jgi:hypothetical protein
MDAATDGVRQQKCWTVENYALPATTFGDAYAGNFVTSPTPLALPPTGRIQTRPLREIHHRRIAL